MGKYATPLVTETYAAGGTITAGQLVERSAANTVIAADGDSDLCTGIALTGAASGEKVDVAVLGKAVAISGGTITFGQRLTSNGSVTAGTVKVHDGATDMLIGVALEDAASGDHFYMLVTPSGGI
jgi:hypothetical protein